MLLFTLFLVFLAGSSILLRPKISYSPSSIAQILANYINNTYGYRLIYTPALIVLYNGKLTVILNGIRYTTRLNRNTVDSSGTGLIAVLGNKTHIWIGNPFNTSAPSVFNVHFVSIGSEALVTNSYALLSISNEPQSLRDLDIKSAFLFVYMNGHAYGNRFKWPIYYELEKSYYPPYYIQYYYPYLYGRSHWLLGLATEKGKVLKTKVIKVELIQLKDYYKTGSYIYAVLFPYSDMQKLCRNKGVSTSILKKVVLRPNTSVLIKYSEPFAIAFGYYHQEHDDFHAGNQVFYRLYRIRYSTVNEVVYRIAGVKNEGNRIAYIRIRYISGFGSIKLWLNNTEEINFPSIKTGKWLSLYPNQQYIVRAYIKGGKFYYKFYIDCADSSYNILRELVIEIRSSNF